MKWFKHFTDAIRSEKLLALKARHGLEGIARYYMILDSVAEKMDKSDRCSLHYPARDWAKILDYYQVKPMLIFLQSCADLRLILFECRDNVVTISVPNLLKCRDNYTKGLEETSKKLPSKEVEVEVEERRRHLNLSSPTPSPLSVDNSVRKEPERVLKSKSNPVQTTAEALANLGNGTGKPQPKPKGIPESFTDMLNSLPGDAPELSAQDEQQLRDLCGTKALKGFREALIGRIESLKLDPPANVKNRAAYGFSILRNMNTG